MSPYTKKLFSLQVFLSSYFLFNTMGDLSEDSLLYLKPIRDIVKKINKNAD